jgi:hypothetical protein
VAQVAVETGIPPQFLLDDPHMLKAIVAVMNERNKQRKKANRGR